MAFGIGLAPEMAKTEIATVGFESVADAPKIFHYPEDDLRNARFETGLQGKTTAFVHK